MEARSTTGWPWFAWVAVTGTVAWAVVAVVMAQARHGAGGDRVDALEARVDALEDRLDPETG